MPDIGDRYQSETKYHADHMGRSVQRPNASRDARGTVIELPDPERTGGASLWETLAYRRSERAYEDQPISSSELSQLLWATQGVTKRVRGYAFRTAPSAGALYPVDTYVIVHRVEGIEPGVYRYQLEDHQLEGVVEGRYDRSLTDAALGQRFAGNAAVAFIWTAVIERSKRKYRARAYRYIYIEAGHIGQNLQLAAQAMGLECCHIGAFLDDEVNALVGADGAEETAVYLGVVGRGR